MSETGDRGHVAMLVRNSFTHDTRVEKEARTLAAAGYRVTIVADAAAGLPGRESLGGIEVHRVARRGPRMPGVRFVIHEARLARALRVLRADVYHAHDSNTLIPVALAARARRVPFVTTPTTFGSAGRAGNDRACTSPSVRPSMASSSGGSCRAPPSR